MRVLILVSCVVVFAAGSKAAGSKAQEKKRFAKINDWVEQAISAGDLPGAVVCFADADKVRYLKTFGDRQVEPTRSPMTVDTVFDLASITKPVATATSVALLCQQGKLDYAAPVSRYLPEFIGNQKETITVAQCLLHTSGLTPDNALSDYSDGETLAWKRICELGLRSDPGTKFAYSDVGFIVLGNLVQKVSGQPLDAYAKDNIFEPFGMLETTFNPSSELAGRTAPTEKQAGKWLRGQVHDPRASRLGGVAGHAGLFSTAADLVTFGQTLLKAGKGQSDVMNRVTLQAMIRPRTIPRGTRTFGWDNQSPYSSNRGTSLSDQAFGHGGFTGTVLWIDPEKELIFVFLSSRLHPDGKGSVNKLAGEIVTLVGQQW